MMGAFCSCWEKITNDEQDTNGTYVYFDRCSRPSSIVDSDPGSANPGRSVPSTQCPSSFPARRNKESESPKPWFYISENSDEDAAMDDIDYAAVSKIKAKEFEEALYRNKYIYWWAEDQTSVESNEGSSATENVIQFSIEKVLNDPNAKGMAKASSTSSGIYQHCNCKFCQ